VDEKEQAEWEQRVAEKAAEAAAKARKAEEDQQAAAERNEN
jgi:hypothetical protein